MALLGSRCRGSMVDICGYEGLTICGRRRLSARVEDVKVEFVSVLLAQHVGRFICTLSKGLSRLPGLSAARGLYGLGARLQDHANARASVLLAAPADLERLSAVRVGEKVLTVSKVVVKLPDTDRAVNLRPRTSDIRTFEQIFIDQEYAIPALPANIQTLVDLGANIGLSAVYFANKYPKARILAVEPDRDNYEMLVENTAAFGDQIQSRNVAVWKSGGYVSLHSEDTSGATLDSWGFRTSDGVGSSTSTRTRCERIDVLLDEAGLLDVDILKIDIEGAELEIFSERPEEWLHRIRFIIIETHDGFRAGSEKAVRNAIRETFDELPRSGENLIFRAKEDPAVRRSANRHFADHSVLSQPSA